MASLMVSDLTDADVEALFDENHVPEADRVIVRREVAISRALRFSGEAE